ncbi:hypothetical protein [Blastopirellula marina]|uniref:Formylmethanofuran dehydrogenase subunit B, selenocysteine containing n=1 Tax=Blastopirellula marina DSM 3645 TaxID=314230 RepID=A3ZNP3_9BACT|nr:hypothetical protein [Blastopirellula marina]EAQ81941.1 Formylmethanofuran dehydrogenase subunit B, selenocysteine containing [Blastopirellula marina DSM 3645]
MSQPITFADVVCCGCSCLCDDLQITVAAGQIAQIAPACPHAASYFAIAEDAQSNCQINGKAATIDTAIAAATKLLAGAKSPLLLGLGELTIDGQRAALDWADRLGAYVDAGNPAESDPSGVVLQSTGMITATLGEIRDRADVILFWNADPATTQPRHFTRFSLDAPGRFLTAPRTALAIDSQATATTARAELFCESPLSQNLETAHTLLALARGKKIDRKRVPQLQDIESIHARLSSATYAAIVCAPRFYGGADGAAILETLADYVRELNRNSRAIISLERSGPNWIGAAESIAWRTGYPSPVRFAADGPTFDPTGYRAAKLLSRGQVDALIRFDGDWLTSAPSELLTAMAKLPTISLGWRQSELPANIQFRVAKPGVECGGSMHRLDDVPLPLTQVLPTTRMTAEDAIRRMTNASCAASGLTSSLRSPSV